MGSSAERSGGFGGIGDQSELICVSGCPCGASGGLWLCARLFSDIVACVADCGRTAGSGSKQMIVGLCGAADFADWMMSLLIEVGEDINGAAIRVAGGSGDDDGASIGAADGGGLIYESGTVGNTEGG